MAAAPRPRGRPAGTSTPSGRDRLLVAARAEFARDGLSGASVEAITAAAGVGPPTLYHHFGNKRGLFVAVVADVYAQVLAHFEAAVDGTPGSFHEALDAVLRSSVPVMRADAGLSAMIAVAQIEFRRDPDLAEALRPGMRAFRAFFDDLAARAPSDLCAGPTCRRNLALALITVITGLNAQALLLESLDDYEGVVDAMRRLVTASIR